VQQVNTSAAEVSSKIQTSNTYSQNKDVMTLYYIVH